MKGIVLAGGRGTRLYPMTHMVNKHLLPLYDKPMIYYPLSALMLAGIREILLISSPGDLPLFRSLLGDGDRFGLTLRYAEQARPEGIAQAFGLARDFLRGHSSCLVLGDNIFYGEGLTKLLSEAAALQRGAKVFGYHVSDPQRHGVVEFGPDGSVASIEEKPTHPRSNYVIPGIYFFDADAVDMADKLKPSSRGELEITDLISMYHRRGDLIVHKTGRGLAWLDTGTARSLLEAANFISAIETRQGLKIGCLEEIAWHKGWITTKQIVAAAESLGHCEYGCYLQKIVSEESIAVRKVHGNVEEITSCQ
jgi:glucose-1-phosphate thymidylyltransferase